MRRIKKIKVKLLNTAIMLSLLTPFYIKRENILFTNDNAYESLNDDNMHSSTLIYDAYVDDNSKLENSNIKTLVIRNSSYLTDEEKDIIKNNDNIDNFVISYGLTDINDQNINLDFLNSNVNVNVILDEVIKNFDKDSELYNFLVYKKYKDYKKNDNHNVYLLEKYSSEDIEKFEIFDEHLNDIVSSFNLDENSDDYSKIISVISYVTNHIYYDKDVAAGNKQGKENSTKYNNNLLSTTLENEPYYACEGVCCNYAALTTVLGYYVGVDLDYMSGIQKESGHAWNEYIDNEEVVVFDTTSLDNWDTYQELIFHYNLHDQKNGIDDDLTHSLVKVLETEKDYYENKYKIYKEYSKKYNLSKVEWLRRMYLLLCVGILYLLLYSAKKIEDKKKIKKIR